MSRQKVGVPPRSLRESADRRPAARFARRDDRRRGDRRADAVKGIGRWSAEMFLMFRLHRPDVLPVGRLGIVNAVRACTVSGRSRRPIASARSAKRGGRTVRSRRGISGGAWTTSPDNRQADTHEPIVASRCEILFFSLALSPTRPSCSPPADYLAAAQQAAAVRTRTQEMGRRRRPRADDEAGVRHVRRHVDERGRQPRRPPHRVRSARRHLHDADRRQRRVSRRRGSPAGPRSTCSRASAPTASGSRSSAIATGSGTSGPMDADGKNARQISKEQRWFINSPTWSPDGQLHLRAAALRRRSDRSAPARSGCST